MLAEVGLKMMMSLICVSRLPFLMPFYKAACANLHLQSTAKASVVRITDQFL